MKKTILGVLLVLSLALILWGGSSALPDTRETPGDRGGAQTEDTGETTGETIPATTPADGDPDDVTCKGSYTTAPNDWAVVATIGENKLTNGVLQAYYWAEVTRYRQENHDPAPDFSRPLDSQSCPVDDSVASWQQYFLKAALNTWHSAQALTLQSQAENLPREEAYQPNLKNHEKYLQNMPATRYLYGYNDTFTPNTLHQEFLDALPETLNTLAGEKGYADISSMAEFAFGTTEENLLTFAEVYNRGYIYFTNLGYYLEHTQEDVESYFTEREEVFRAEGITKTSGNYVDIRQILIRPDNTTAAGWEACEAEAAALLEYWQKKTRETDATFAELANQNSDDAGSSINGGAYRRLEKGQLRSELDSWCFDPSRQAGDSTIIRTEEGCHILYISKITEIWYAEAEAALNAALYSGLIETARQKYPMQVDYSAIALVEADPQVSGSDLLYPDIAHERFPEVPLYLQQDYPTTMYGGYKITTNGCGITSFAMLASYMADDELTPAEMCDRYGNYSHSNGTDGMIFNYEPAVLGFYLREKTYEPSVAKQALADGHIVISIQHKGYWTSGGHYIVLEEMSEDGLIQVRDSNIYNYGKIKAHKEDLHTWGSITGAGSGFWIYEYKITHIPACSRCGTQEGMEDSPVTSDYICEKCQSALLRRNAYLTFCGA